MKLAQLNVALAKYPLDAPEIKDFVDNLDLVNSIAESSEGFVWCLKDESGDETNIKAFDDPNMIVNVSVDALKNFMFRTHHRDFMRRKGEWFHRLAEGTYMLWWVKDDHNPTLNEAVERLDHLREVGDSPYAFTFKTNFTEKEVPR